MGRIPHYRIWDNETKEYLTEEWGPFSEDLIDYETSERETQQGNGCLDVRFISPDNLVFEQYTGIKDRNNRELAEGDIVLVQEARYEESLLTTIGGIPFYEIHEDKPLPAPDIPLARGVIEWSEGAFICKYVWICDDWKELPPTGHVLHHVLYAYEIVGNCNQNPELL